MAPISSGYALGATQISEAWLIPLLEANVGAICGFHSDCSGEFINRKTVQLLNKLLIEQTKSRSRHSKDNGLVEAKNGALVRMHMGYWPISAAHTEAIDGSTQSTLIRI